jgi:hypothetical protein
MSALRAIVIGSGWGAHSANALASDPRVDLRAVVGRGSARTVALAASLGIPLVRELDAGLAAHAPDLVVLAVGEHAHESLAIRALGAGANILCAHPVASEATAIRRIDEAARRASKIVRTDYTFRLRPEFAALVGGDGRGELLRVAIDAPGRWLPIALDTAYAIAGEITRVTASRIYPEPLAERSAQTPQAFPPTVTLEHARGVVTTIVPMPHAWLGAPVRVQASWERTRVEAQLPRGGAQSLSCVRGGKVETAQLVAAEGDLRDPSEHSRAMAAVALAFVDAISGGPDLLATMADEAHLRVVWSCIWRSCRERTSVTIPVT